MCLFKCITAQAAQAETTITEQAMVRCKRGEEWTFSTFAKKH